MKYKLVILIAAITIAVAALLYTFLYFHEDTNPRLGTVDEECIDTLYKLLPGSNTITEFYSFDLDMVKAEYQTLIKRAISSEEIPEKVQRKLHNWLEQEIFSAQIGEEGVSISWGWSSDTASDGSFYGSVSEYTFYDEPVSSERLVLDNFSLFSFKYDRKEWVFRFLIGGGYGYKPISQLVAGTAHRSFTSTATATGQNKNWDETSYALTWTKYAAAVSVLLTVEVKRYGLFGRKKNRFCEAIYDSAYLYTSAYFDTTRQYFDEKKDFAW